MNRTCADCGDLCGTFMRCRRCAAAATAATAATDPSGVGSGGGQRAAVGYLGVFSVGCPCGARVGDPCDPNLIEDVRVIVHEGRYVTTIHEARYRGGEPDPDVILQDHAPVPVGPVVASFTESMQRHGYEKGDAR